MGLAALASLGLLSSCTVVSANRVFPRLSWYWSAEAREQRAEAAADRQLDQQLRATATNAPVPSGR
jgi:hypothetical protein